MADVQIHVGDQGKVTDLLKVAQSSSKDGLWDVIVDDGSHINAHQILTVETLIPFLNRGGFFIVEDISSACANWTANMGSYLGPGVGGSADCMGTIEKPSIYRKIVQWQKQLLNANSPFKGVDHIDINFQSVVIEKNFP